MTAALARLVRRPDPKDWADDDPMTLVEAIAVYWPDGPLKVHSLRVEIAAGRLPYAEVAGKHYVTPANLKALFAPETKPCLAKPRAPDCISGETGSTASPASPSQVMAHPAMGWVDMISSSFMRGSLAQPTLRDPVTGRPEPPLPDGPI